MGSNKALCLKQWHDDKVVKSYYYTLNNPDTIFSFNGDLILAEDCSYLDFHSDFAKVSGDYETWFYSLQDYWFDYRCAFSNSSMASKGFTGFFVYESSYPIEEIKKRLGESGMFSSDGIVAFPISWFNTLKMNDFLDCLREDIANKEAEHRTMMMEEYIEF